VTAFFRSYNTPPSLTPPSESAILLKGWSQTHEEQRTSRIGLKKDSIVTDRIAYLLNVMKLITFWLLVVSVRANTGNKPPVAATRRRPTFVTSRHNNLQERVRVYYHEHLHENAQAAELYDVDNWFDAVVTSCLEAVIRRRHHAQ